MNENEIVQWLETAANHASLAFKRTKEATYRSKAEAFKEAADYIKNTVKDRYNAKMAAIYRKPINEENS